MKFKGTVIKGFQVGSAFGIATANIEVKKRPRIKDGVYLVRVLLSSSGLTRGSRKSHKLDGPIKSDHDNYLKGLLHIGPRKTFGGDFSIELHLLDFDEDLYGQELEIETLHYLRDNQKFRNADALYSQIERDIIKARKYFLRQAILSHWEKVSQTQKKVWEARAVETILADPDFIGGEVVLLYAPEEDREIDFVRRLLELCPQKQYFFPRVKGKALEFFSVKRFDHLQPGFAGIAEPLPDENPWNPALFESQKQLIFVPSVALDHHSRRLGRGGGYYDRFLASLGARSKHRKTMSIVPSFAYFETIPHEVHDTRVDKVIVL